MRIENSDERRFYEIEAVENGWGLAELKRQFKSSLYERLALSRDKKGVLAWHLASPHARSALKRGFGIITNIR